MIVLALTQEAEEMQATMPAIEQDAGEAPGMKAGAGLFCCSLTFLAHLPYLPCLPYMLDKIAHLPLWLHDAGDSDQGIANAVGIGKRGKRYTDASGRGRTGGLNRLR